MQGSANGARPPSVSRGLLLLYASLGIGLIRSAMGFPRFAQMSSVGFAVSVQVVVFAIFLVLLVFIARRKNWARIAFLVIFMLGVPPSMGLLLDSLSGTPMSGVLGLLQVALQIVALVLLFRSEAAAWFRQVSTPST